MNHFSNKVAVITGSTLGIGKSLAFALAKQGAKVVINGRNKVRLEKVHKELLANGFDAHAIEGDVSKPEDCRRLIEEAVQQYGRLDIVVTNAGINMWGTIEESDPLALKKVMDVNFFGTLWVLQAAIPHVRKTKGSLLMIGSIAGFHGLPLNSVYSASKRALTPIAEALKIELNGSGIHVGLAYVGLTEIEEEKRVLDENGKSVPKSEIGGGTKPEPIENVTARVLQMLEKRTFKRTFTMLGKLNKVANKVAPSLVQRVIQSNYDKKMN